MNSCGSFPSLNPELVPATHLAVILFWRRNFDIQTQQQSQWIIGVLELTTSIKNLSLFSAVWPTEYSEHVNRSEESHYLTGISAGIKETLWCIIVTMNKIDALSQK